MGYYARLRKGSRTLDLSSGNYSIPAGFVPPSASEDVVLGVGAGMNRFGGSARVDVDAPNRAFVFDLDISGDTGGEIERALRDVRDFLQLAGDESEPLYFDWLPHSNVGGITPLSGQWNNWRSYELVWGAATPGGNYGTMRNSYLADCRIETMMKPYPLGGEHLVGHALGGVYSDIYPGDATGRSRGVIVHPGGTNLVTNGNFEIDTAGWSKAAALELMERSDKEAMFGKYSLRLAESSSAGSGEYAASTDIAVTANESYVASAWIKKTVGAGAGGALRIYWYTAASAFISSDSVTFATGPQDWTEYVVIGTAPATAAKATILIILALSGETGKSLELFADGVRMFHTDRLMPYADGDWRGAAWSGTRHASTSVITAGKLYYNFDSILPRPYSATLSFVITPYQDDYPIAGYYLFDAGSITFEMWYDPSISKWKFTDNYAHSTLSAVATFGPGVPVAIDLVLKDNTAQIYLNGVASGSAGVYQPVGGGGSLYIGSDAAGANHAAWSYQAFEPYDYPLTAAQVAADYANKLPLITAGKRIDWLPFNWGTSVDSADNIRLYNSNDAAAQTNFAIVCEMPGTVEAVTRIRLDCQDTKLSTNNLGGIFLSRMLAPVGYPLRRLLPFYGELSGTTDTISSGFAYEALGTNGTTRVAYTLAIPMLDEHIDILSGEEIALLCRLADQDDEATLQIALAYGFSTETNFVSEYKTLGADTDHVFHAFLTPFLGFKDIRRGILRAAATPDYDTDAGFYLYAKRSTSDTDAVWGDYYQIVTKPTLRIWSESAAEADRIVIYDSRTGEVLNLDASDFIASDKVHVEASDPFELVPGYDNFIIYAAGDIKRQYAGTEYDDTIAVEEIKVTPRWGLG